MEYVSRGGLKLEAALDGFGIDPCGWVCADLGCSTGGFTDCLLQRGAGHVYSVDTAYGELAWKLRQDPRVTVIERTNAVHFEPGGEAGSSGGRMVAAEAESAISDFKSEIPDFATNTSSSEDEIATSPPLTPCRLVVVDLGWTPQRLAVPAALRWLEASAGARIITLVKPHYESTGGSGGSRRRGKHRLSDEEAEAVVVRVLEEMPRWGARVVRRCPSPIRGGKGGNPEELVLLERV